MILIIAVGALLSAVVFLLKWQPHTYEDEIVKQYAESAHSSYRNALEKATALQATTNLLLESPSEETLQMAKRAWVAAHNAFSLTEVYRFYGGPIDSVYTQLDGWPINESLIDGTLEMPKGGLTNSGKLITSELLLAGNKSEEKPILTGFHVVEFLLWGEFITPAEKNFRKPEDFKEGDADNNARREYLQTATALLMGDLQQLLNAWTPMESNYFTDQETKKSLKDIHTGIKTLSRTLAEDLRATLAGKKFYTSRFSGTTGQTYMQLVESMENAYFGKRGGKSYPSIYVLMLRKNKPLAQETAQKLWDARLLLAKLLSPLDKHLFYSLQGSPERYKAKLLIEKLEDFAASIEEAEKKLRL